MTPEERKEAAFEFKSAIRGMVWYRKQWRPGRVSLGAESDKYWQEIKDRRLLYQKYLNRLKKYMKPNKPDFSKTIDTDRIKNMSDEDVERVLKMFGEDVEKYATEDEKKKLKEGEK